MALSPPKQELELDTVIILHLIASGVLALAEATRDGQPVPIPYPPALQRGLDRLTVRCWQAHTAPPASIPDLLEWCRRPLASWPLLLDQLDVGGGDTMLVGGVVTRVCEEWAIASQDPEVHVLEEHLLLDVLEACRIAGDQDGYVAFRSLLIESPVLTALELLELRSQPRLATMSEYLPAAYRPAPLECITGDVVTCCAGCRNLLVRVWDGTMRCVEDRCPFVGQSRAGKTLAVRDEVYWLRRDLRAFVASPGRAELRLARQLRKSRLAVELWPRLDTYDLRVTFGDGVTWAVDVKDWVNPVLLARRVSPIPSAPPWHRGFFVFPQERLRRPDYLRAFKANCRCLGGEPQVDAMSDKRFLELARRRSKGVV